ncbi:MAG: hypothetical protein PHD32_05825 [Eubacteriales bacterium]|nr:hypothetical protein [Eubacteriales bacterium]
MEQNKWRRFWSWVGRNRQLIPVGVAAIAAVVAGLCWLGSGSGRKWYDSGATRTPAMSTMAESTINPTATQMLWCNVITLDEFAYQYRQYWVKACELNGKTVSQADAPFQADDFAVTAQKPGEYQEYTAIWGDFYFEMRLVCDEAGNVYEVSTRPQENVLPYVGSASKEVRDAYINNLAMYNALAVAILFDMEPDDVLSWYTETVAIAVEDGSEAVSTRNCGWIRIDQCPTPLGGSIALGLTAHQN